MLDPRFLSLPIAHRAYHDRAQRRPENSLAAIRAAIAAGYGIEIDLQLSADGVAMVFHDYLLDRLTGETGPLHARTAAELQAIPLRDADEGIPTFAEVLDLVAGQVPLLVEIKNQNDRNGAGLGPLEDAAAQALRGYQGPVAVMGFNPETIALFHAAAPEVTVGLTTYAEWSAEDFPDLDDDQRARLREIADYDRVGASFISHHWKDLGMARVAALKAEGAHILCWTIRSPEAEAKAREVAENVTFEGYAPALPDA
ncbi:glycerophosphodiester phosphodiesterase family protein [Thioclava sp. 'Guangxiensis']|uniref:glycerophosphodiester phosphodiesterase family protein n=1 Tax=Thioclava sp. 'Guangxiensis' TaxID=3149044 RepID=UPI003878270B